MIDFVCVNDVALSFFKLNLSDSLKLSSKYYCELTQLGHRLRADYEPANLSKKPLIPPVHAAVKHF